MKEKRTNKPQNDLELIAGIDIGGGQISCVIGMVHEYKKEAEVLSGAVIQCQDGIGIDEKNVGAVINIEEAAKGIENVLKEAERKAGGKVQDAILAIRGSSIEAFNARGTSATDISTREITQETIEMAISNAEEKIMGNLKSSCDIFQIIQKNLTFDDGTKASLGMQGLNLNADVYALVAPHFSMINLEKALDRAQVNVKNKVYSYLAASDISLRKQEKELGCIFVDFGGATIGLVVFVNHTLKFTCEIQVGAETITRDLSSYLKTPPEDAKKIKEDYGAALIGDSFQNSDFEYFIADGETIQKSERRYIIEEAIMPAIDRILTAIENILKKNGYDKEQIKGGIILTGGGSRMEYIKDAFERFFGDHYGYVRVAKPQADKISGNPEIINNPSYSAAIGALYYSLSSSSSEPRGSAYENNARSSGGLSGVIQKIKDFFKENIL
jgi:cell division protein FtsA